jgi:poly-gamma-glutamate synthesis protein (capsule biosynthesis protein)
MIRILIGGDVCPMGRIENEFVRGNADEIFHDLLEEIAGADLSIVNLECPLVTQKTPIAKAGPVLGASADCIRGFAAAKWHVINLANNHSYDHGARGLQETMSVINSARLSVVGAGANIKEAQLPYVTQINGNRIVIYSMAEHEFSIAGNNVPGANPLDLINFVNAIQQYKQKGIFIVLIHGGREYYPYPSPEMVRRCRFMIDMGADAVICCHAHCPLPWEIYSNRPIIYGLGNLIFEAFSQEPDAWYKGYLAKLTVEDGRIRFEAIPYFQSQAHSGVKKMNEDARISFFNEMERKSDQVKNGEFLEDQWAKYCREQKDIYMAMLFGHNRLMRKASRFLPKTLHSKKEMLQALLLVQCETHREILNSIFKDERGEG